MDRRPVAQMPASHRPQAPIYNTIAPTLGIAASTTSMAQQESIAPVVALQHYGDMQYVSVSQQQIMQAREKPNQSQPPPTHYMGGMQQHTLGPARQGVTPASQQMQAIQQYQLNAQQRLRQQQQAMGRQTQGQQMLQNPGNSMLARGSVGGAQMQGISPGAQQPMYRTQAVKYQQQQQQQQPQQQGCLQTAAMLGSNPSRPGTPGAAQTNNALHQQTLNPVQWLNPQQQIAMGGQTQGQQMMPTPGNNMLAGGSVGGAQMQDISWGAQQSMYGTQAVEHQQQQQQQRQGYLQTNSMLGSNPSKPLIPGATLINSALHQETLYPVEWLNSDQWLNPQQQQPIGDETQGECINFKQWLDRHEQQSIGDQTQGQHMLQNPGISMLGGGSVGGAKMQGNSSGAKKPFYQTQVVKYQQEQQPQQPQKQGDIQTAMTFASKPSTPRAERAAQRYSALPSSAPVAAGNTQPRAATGSILSKRSLRELLAEIDPGAFLDPDVEDMLLEIADDFIESVASFACKLAKHRKSSVLEAKDVRLHLDKQWNIMVPGFGEDKIYLTSAPM